VEIRLGMLSIKCINLNMVNSSYAVNPLHMFSECCNERVGLKKYCKSCNKELLATEIKKGSDKEHILTEEQQDRLKTLLDNSTINVLSIKDKEEDTLYNLIPIIQKSQIVLPKLDDKRINIEMFYGFKNALKDKIALCKLVNRGKEHLVILTDFKNDLLAVEIPFSKYINSDEVNRLKEATENEIVRLKADVDKYTTQAKQFVESYDKGTEISQVKEEKIALMRSFLEEVNKPFKEEQEEQQKEEENPFVVSPLPKKKK